MNRHLLKGHYYLRRLKQVSRAITEYQHAANSCHHHDKQAYQHALYMLAYSYAKQAESIHCDMDVLGVDLRHGTHDPYMQAAVYMRMVENDDFQPQRFHLPKIPAHSRKEMEAAVNDMGAVDVLPVQKPRVTEKLRYALGL
tara:strand:+ start:56200 stop:56622 length:423 start_codon:yes stop_codon:yes gene_type:complete